MVDKFVFYRIKKNDKRIDFLKKNKINFVTWGRSSTKDNYAWIDLDNEKSIEILMQRLYDFGHRKIGFLMFTKVLTMDFKEKKLTKNFTKIKISNLMLNIIKESLDHTTLTGIQLSKKLWI